MSNNEDTKKSELSPFENKLIERLKRANERLQGVDDIEQLRPELTIRSRDAPKLPAVLRG